jgi:hypothetical protein
MSTGRGDGAAAGAKCPTKAAGRRLMRKIFRFLDSALRRFRKRLTREKALRLFMIAMMAKDDALAVSINLDPDAYYCLLHL